MVVSAINNGGGFYRTEVYIHEAKMSGATIHNPCVNKSLNETTVYDKDIYLGFMHLKSIDSQLAISIVEERGKNGAFTSLEDFVRRIQIGIEGLQILVFIGAFRFTGKEKNELVLASRLLLVNFKPENRNLMLLQEPIKEYKLPVLERCDFEDAFDEIEILSFPISCSPFDLLQVKYRGDVMANDLLKHHKQHVKMLVYLISIKHNPTVNGMMAFGTWIDAEGQFFDTAHFANSLVAYPFLGGGCYLLFGKVEVDYHFPTVNISKMAKMPFIADPRYTNSKSRQFITQEQMKADVSSTHRAPYPQKSGLPRKK